MAKSADRTIKAVLNMHVTFNHEPTEKELQRIIDAAKACGTVEEADYEVVVPMKRSLV
jgi:hypothetical protein